MASRTACNWPKGSGSVPSITISSRSPPRPLQSRLERSTSAWGRCLTETHGVGDGSGGLTVYDPRTVGSSVANSASSTSRPAPVSRFSRLDFPALVYPASTTDGSSDLRRRVLGSPARGRGPQPPSQAVIWARMRRRSISILVSPGPPRTPIPPTCWISALTPAAQPRQHVLHLREGHLGLAPLCCAHAGQDVEDQPGRSTTLTPTTASSLRNWRVSSPSQIRVRAGRPHDVSQFLGLARSHVRGRVGTERRWVTPRGRPTPPSPRGVPTPPGIGRRPPRCRASTPTARRSKPGPGGTRPQ